MEEGDQEAGARKGIWYVSPFLGFGFGLFGLASGLFGLGSGSGFDLNLDLDPNSGSSLFRFKPAYRQRKKDCIKLN